MKSHHGPPHGFDTSCVYIQDVETVCNVLVKRVNSAHEPVFQMQGSLCIVSEHNSVYIMLDVLYEMWYVSAVKLLQSI